MEIFMIQINMNQITLKRKDTLIITELTLPINITMLINLMKPIHYMSTLNFSYR